MEAKNRTKRRYKKNDKIKVSVIIPTYNEEENIGNLLEDLASQTYKNFEIIVVDDKSTDNTLKVVKKYKDKLNLRILVSGKHMLSYSRNLGIENAKGEILVNLDADCRINEKFLEEIVNAMKDEEVAGLKVGEELTQDSIWEKIDYIRTFYKNRGVTQSVRIFRKGKAKYDEEMIFGCEDMVINEIIKGKVGICKKAKIYHHRYHSTREIFNSWRKYPSCILFIKKYKARNNLKAFILWIQPLFFIFLSPIITIHRLIKFKTPIALLIPIYDAIRTFSYLYGMPKYFKYFFA